jgi:hypothetical protein
MMTISKLDQLLESEQIARINQRAMQNGLIARASLERLYQKSQTIRYILKSEVQLCSLILQADPFQKPSHSFSITEPELLVLPSPERDPFTANNRKLSETNFERV